MNLRFRQLLIASAIGVMSFGAHAQATPETTSTPSMAPPAASTPKMSGDIDSQAASQYEAAQAACNAQTGAAKAACLQDAKSAYDRAIGSNQPGATLASPATPGVPTPAVPESSGGGGGMSDGGGTGAGTGASGGGTAGGGTGAGTGTSGGGTAGGGTGAGTGGAAGGNGDGGTGGGSTGH